MTERDRWHCALWLLRGRMERLASSSPLADLAPYRGLLATLRELCGDYEVPPAVLEEMNRLEYAIRERERMQLRARAVLEH